MKIFDLLWWFFDLDKHSSDINKPAPPAQHPPQELDAVDPDPEDMDLFNGDYDDEIFE